MKLRVLASVVLIAFVAFAALAQAGERVIYEKPSAFGAIVVSEDDDGLRILRIGERRARQSVVRPGDPDFLVLSYARSAFAGLALCADPRRVLVVGLGGGTLPMFLHKHYPEAAIDVVDIDPEVVDVAKRFFGFSEDDNLRAHVGDGRQFIEQIRQPYDMIFLDAYASDSVPQHLTTQEFLRAVRRALKPDGIVVSNVWARHSNPLYDSMVRTYQEVFDELYILSAPQSGNMIVIASSRRQSLSRGELAQLARKVSTSKRFTFDLGALVEYGYLPVDGINQQGRVLRDGDINQPR